MLPPLGAKCRALPCAAVLYFVFERSLFLLLPGEAKAVSVKTKLSLGKIAAAFLVVGLWFVVRSAQALAGDERLRLGRRKAWSPAC